MDDLASLFGSKDTGKDLVDKFTVLFEKQTDHKVSPGLLFGLMGMYNLMNIIGLAKEEMGHGLKSLSTEAAPKEGQQSGNPLMDALAALTSQTSPGSQGSSGGPDLMGLLSGLASKKKINPGLLLPLLSMMNNQSGGSSGTESGSTGGSSPVSSTAHIVKNDDPAGEAKAEKKGPDNRPANDFNRKRS